ncbi:hypothetical protein [Paenibacillus sp. KN14-4R]|uniref:hypothetical protein n=1 Tax=Paenibacillus sp. KN14-4R TaxID=3445773 RepID=UPI003FA14343
MILVWDHWQLARCIVLFVAIAYLLIGIQVTMSHYRQNFYRRVMWAPVLSSPIYFIVGLFLALLGPMWLLHTFHVLMWIALLSGIVGFYYHFRGVGLRIGGYALRNFLVGPPIMMPLMYAAMGALGLLAVYWR